MSRGRPVPPILAEAFEKQKALRQEFSELREVMFDAAEEATKGVMLNRKGRRAKIDTYRLFTSNRAFAYCYASEELVEWWESNPRMTMTQYEQQVFEPEPTPEEQSAWGEPEPSASEEEWAFEDSEPF